jgi:hypothetical protein
VRVGSSACVARTGVVAAGATSEGVVAAVSTLFDPTLNGAEG